MERLFRPRGTVTLMRNMSYSKPVTDYILNTILNQVLIERHCSLAWKKNSFAYAGKKNVLDSSSVFISLLWSIFLHYISCDIYKTGFDRPPCFERHLRKWISIVTVLKIFESDNIFCINFQFSESFISIAEELLQTL